MKLVPLSTSPSARAPGLSHFVSEGLDLAYLDEGPRDGEPIVLVHGFGSNLRVNWVGPGWVDALTRDGRRVIALDNRGHGGSQGPHDPAAYDPATHMSEDVRRLMEHLHIERADVMGYSMGAWITGHLAVNHPDRLRSAIFGGLATAMIDGLGGQEAIAAALDAERDEDVTSPIGRTYRAFGKQTGSDLKALAACMRGSRRPVAREALAGLSMPVLCAVGTRDDVAGDLDAFVALIPGAEALAIPGRDHMQAVGDKVHKQGVLAFLARRP